MEIFILITIIGIILCFILICFLGTQDENQRITDDEEQLKYIEKWKNKKGTKSHSVSACRKSRTFRRNRKEY